ncbi:hypothetical protein HMPREF9436_00226 [Faecalibacterium cf. prausnitzii KLE1255]|uniref:Uncharacterized protein n=1 Tax=Faecalibacterium cf. prausnitzii KLE1255 TaxID=748224 RepID=E2ZEZ7_9FIRM|nr:hypothetical protein HMPREF9436_00226 [Faecalibacterium cf. prausnitzii KLE1255]
MSTGICAKYPLRFPSVCMKIRSGTALFSAGVLYWNTRNTAAAGRQKGVNET